MGSSDDQEYLEAKKLENELHIPVIRHKNKKPDCLDDVSINQIITFILFKKNYIANIVQVIKHFSNKIGPVKPNELCMIGTYSI